MVINSPKSAPAIATQSWHSISRPLSQETNSPPSRVRNAATRLLYFYWPKVFLRRQFGDRSSVNLPVTRDGRRRRRPHMRLRRPFTHDWGQKQEPRTSKSNSHRKTWAKKVTWCCRGGMFLGYPLVGSWLDFTTRTTEPCRTSHSSARPHYQHKFAPISWSIDARAAWSLFAQIGLVVDSNLRFMFWI